MPDPPPMIAAVLPSSVNRFSVNFFLPRVGPHPLHMRRGPTPAAFAPRIPASPRPKAVPRGSRKEPPPRGTNYVGGGGEKAAPPSRGSRKISSAIHHTANA